MNRRHPAFDGAAGAVRLLGGLAAAGVIGACTEATVAPLSPRPPQLEYRLQLPSMGLDSVHVTVTINSWPGDTVCLVAPAMYADNPMVSESEPAFRNLQVRTGSGDTADVLLDSVTCGLFRSLRDKNGGATASSVDYDIAFVFEPNAGLPLPHIGPLSGYIQGTYLFAAPCFPGDTALAQLWRRPWDMTVAHETGPGVSVSGDRLPVVRVANVYGLLFSTSALGGSIVCEGSGGQQRYRVVNVQDTSYGTAMTTRLQADLQRICAAVTLSFGPLDWPLTVILGVNKGGGLEGMHAFSILNPWESDTFGVFNMIAAHEFIHCWVGVRTGELDMPWWKEGTTNYLGFLAARSSGTCRRAYFESSMRRDYRDSADVRDYPLSSPRVRTQLFAPGADMIDLVYGKGGQLCLLMDAALRQAGAEGLDRLVGRFCARYDGGAFTRAEYLGYIEAESGVDMGPIFSRWADRPGAIPDSILAPAYTALELLAGFPPDTFTLVAVHKARFQPSYFKW